MNPRILSALIAVPVLAQPIPDLFGSGPFRPEVPRPSLGLRYTRQHELVAYLQSLAAAAPDRVRLELFNRTEEGHPQPLVIITSPANLRKLEALKAANAKLADPRVCTEAEAAAAANAQPVFLWLGYSVHGYEAGGTEAALAVAYRFAASNDPKVLEQLERVVLVMDVTQNPDGRERHLHTVIEATQGTNPPDPQDAQNTQSWPGGRFNHRLFDLNRDWAFQTQGESRAKAQVFREWNPQLAIDQHEMGPEANPFFPPHVEPTNGHIAKSFAGEWQTRIGQAIGAAMDRDGQAYFTHEIFDLFAPIYGDSWTSLQGIAGMTYEGPNPGGLRYQRKDGELLTLAGRIRRHVLASLGGVETASAHREAILLDYAKVRRERVQLGERAGAFIWAEGRDPGRARALAELLGRNGIEVRRAAEAVPAKSFEPLGPGKPAESYPAGSYVVTLDQPRGALAQALLAREVPVGPKPSYDATAWSLPLMHGVDAGFASSAPKLRLQALERVPPAPLAEGSWGYLLPWGQEGQEKVLATLLQEGFRASAVPEPVTLDGKVHAAGSIALPRLRVDGAKLHARLSELSALHHTPVLPLASARSEKGPDFGSSKALTLKAPRLAVLMDVPASPTAFGEVIHTLREAGLAFTQLRASRLAGAGLRYSHVVLPDDGAGGRRWQKTLGEAGIGRLKQFMQEGGVVIGLEGGAGALVRGGAADAGLHYLAKAAEEAWQKEKDPKREKPKTDPGEWLQPWGQREERALQEGVPGALLKVKVDLTHPLAWGLNAPEGTALNTSDLILEASPSKENPIFYPKEPLRLAGTVPSALEPKLQQTAYALRERKGKGALILFSGDPLFRGCAPFTTRAFLNAIFFGGYAPSEEE
jgi:hypothetical protein